MRVERPHYGNDMPIALFRLLRLVVLEDLFGPAATATGYLAGKKLGSTLPLASLDDFLRLCEDMRLGRVSARQIATGHFHVDVEECLTCAGLRPVGRPVCSFESGLIAGALQRITGQAVVSREVTCIGGLGDATCGFEIHIGNPAEMK
ncbi:MAG: DUF2507 domain-containing protein [Rhodocyclaceae bacterium]